MLKTKPSKNVAPAYVSSGARVYTAEAVEAQARARAPAMKKSEEDILYIKEVLETVMSV